MAPTALKTETFQKNLENLSPSEQASRAVRAQINYNPYASKVYQSKGLFESRKKNTKVMLLGRRLKEVLNKVMEIDSQEDYDELPDGHKLLWKFKKKFSEADILEFLEYLESQEITFRHKNYPNKFKALFKDFSELTDLDMQVGLNSYINLSDSFELKQKLKKIFYKVKGELRLK